MSCASKCYREALKTSRNTTSETEACGQWSETLQWKNKMDGGRSETGGNWCKQRWKESVKKKKFRYFHIRTAGASAKTESFIGDYCWRLMESDNTTTQAGKRGGRQEPQFSFQNSNCKANNLFPHDLFSTLCFCACTHLREMHFLKWLF